MMWHLQSSSQISASSCPSTLSTNISFTKLGGSSVYISGPVTEAWTERPGEECFLWSFDRHNYLSLPQKLRGCSADISDPRRYRKRLVWESPGALHGSRLVTQVGVQRYKHSSLQPQLLGSSDLPASVPRVAGAAAPCHYTWLTFVLFVETGFCHIAQAALKLLSLRPGCSSDPPTLASQGARITGMIHLSWFIFLKLGIIFLKQPQ
ncbi:protein cornichon homolog 3 isoform X3 [Rhinopithecus roxellana]|uniref:protein cornichon homolog 3 isoform X3 n=1 Tax=Rhinopithecus roxellana TaxID=61622 RepID=UPI0012374B9C|nr:protein cornichon homolog 3 isoform X3 [Rhinopithecus roxellana]XP_030792959.1 protein cornichon homolog 3 isoform X3 [Rhinopithecus roxellana]